jgi:hypothetical protein
MSLSYLPLRETSRFFSEMREMLNCCLLPHRFGRGNITRQGDAESIQQLLQHVYSDDLLVWASIASGLLLLIATKAHSTATCLRVATRHILTFQPKNAETGLTAVPQNIELGSLNKSTWSIMAFLMVFFL